MTTEPTPKQQEEARDRDDLPTLIATRIYMEIDGVPDVPEMARIIAEELAQPPLLSFAVIDAIEAGTELQSVRELCQTIRALSSWDTEIREVLEGLMRATTGQPCWCGEGDYVHNDQDRACLAARALWERIQPEQKGNEEDA